MSPCAKKERRSLADILARRKLLITGTVLAGIGISMVAFKYSPRTYKVQTTISIQTQYFQVPMVSDFVPQTYDETELRSQRESLVRESLDYEYLRGLGARFGLFGGAKPADVTSYELNKLARKFEIVNLNAMTFLVSFLSPDPVLGYKVIEDYTDHLRKSIESDRHTMLSQLRDAIKDQLELLAFGGKNSGPGIMFSRPDLVKQEASREREELKQLRSVFSDKHPRIIELEAKLARLSRYLKPPQAEKDAEKDLERTVDQERFSSAKLDPGSQELFRDLLKKFHYISVVMYMDAQNHDSYLIQLQEPFVPKTPLWPKRPLFLAWGVAIGLLGGALFSLFLESREARESRESRGERARRKRASAARKAAGRYPVKSPGRSLSRSPAKPRKKEARPSVLVVSRAPSSPSSVTRAQPPPFRKPAVPPPFRPPLPVAEE